MQVVAHPDDDLLFMSPDLLHDIQAGKCVRTVVVTAGDRTGDMVHVQLREQGLEQAYAQMAGADNTWTTSDPGIPGHPMQLLTLAGRPNISLVFMRLKEGIWGTSTAQDDTLRNLWLGNVSQLATDDGSSSYTKQDLTATLTALMRAFQPDTIRAQDYVGSFGDGDHDDHHAAAYLAQAAQVSYQPAHTFVGYMDYATENNPQNVFGSDLTAKTNAFNAYVQFDTGPCGGPPECGTNDFGQWLTRQYVVGSGGTPPPNSGPITTITSPSANQTVSGTINVTATEQDQSGSGMWLTAFRIDSPSATPVAVDYASPWSFSLDTTKLADGQHTLYVRGADLAGDVGSDATVTFTVDNTNTPPGGGGTTPTPDPGPITSFTSPTANQTICGSFDVAATAQDQSGTGMWLTAFRVDSQSGSPLAIDYSSPWGFSLDTTTLANGQHTLYVRGADHAGNVGQDASVAFNVDNSATSSCAPAQGPTPNAGPITTIATPGAGQTVSGTVNVTATEQDQSGSGIWLTAFRVDSPTADPIAVDYSSPWGFSLDTTKLADGQHTLYVRGADHAGNVGPDATVTFTVDNSSGSGGSTPPANPGPVTSFTSPAPSSTVSGTIQVAATAQDQSGTGMWLTAFRIDSPDGSPLAVDYASPWGFSLDTTTLADGPHTLYVRGADHAGNVGPDATVTFTVDNADASPGGGSPPPSQGPIVTIAAPGASQTVSGTIDVSATVQDTSGSGIWLTAFRLDSPDAAPAIVDYTSPWGFSLDTTQLTNGLHTLFVRSEDNLLNVSPDATVTFNVQN